MAQQKKNKVGRPKLPKGDAKGRIVPVRFRADDINQTVRNGLGARFVPTFNPEKVKLAVPKRECRLGPFTSPLDSVPLYKLI